MYSLPRKGTGKFVSNFDGRTSKISQDVDDNALDKMDMLCKKLKDLDLLIKKSKSKQSVQDVICHKCKRLGHYEIQYQMRAHAVNLCSHCGGYVHFAAACCKKEASEARARTQSQNT